jgi:hypothetical protein
MTLPLITDTGELDMLAIAQRASLRASADYGGPNYPPSRLRQWEAATMDRAQSERRVWRREHGLPDDTVTTMIEVPSWGNSGEGFGR